MGEVRFMISEAAKQVKVESHVLRYWEEELNLEIGRTEMGHRYYTKDDIQLFSCIKKLKDEGMLLKDLKPLIPELKATRSRLQSSNEREAAPVNSTPAAGTKSVFQLKSDSKKEPEKSVSNASSVPALKLNQVSEKKVDSAALTLADAEVIPITQLEQVRSLIGNVLTEVVTANNETLKQDISKTVTKDVMREMDFLFQAKERQEEEHFRKLDCLIRQQQASRKEAAHETPIGKLKKLLT